ncbi:MAG: hypothetical protein QNJ54_28600 [Prochloraceae cyanobacterium]|nr:hypothetical protein [Prochloraceae cyanobacterium]
MPNLALSQIEIIINVAAIVGIVYRMGVKEGETERKINRACDAIEKKISEHKIRIVKTELDLKDLEKSLSTRDTILRKENEWGQAQDDRRIRRIFGILGDMEKKLKDRGIYLDSNRSTHY